MSDAVGAPPRTASKVETRTAKPPIYKVLLHNDDFTPRDFVVDVLGAVFRMPMQSAHGVMLTAHMKGCCVVAVLTHEVAETKATQATDLGRREGYPLRFTTEPET